MIWQSWQILAVEDMYVGLLTISIAGLLMFRALSMAERHMLRWRPANLR